jgi:hypothetical protein
MAQRLLPLILAVWYSLTSTQVVWAVLTWAAPATKVVVKEDFPCADHDCGCATAAQCRRHCCCHLTPEPAQTGMSCHLPDPRPRTVRILHLSAMRCAGGRSDNPSVGPTRLDPHLPIAPVAITAGLNPQPYRFQLEPFRTPPLASPPDKVPIRTIA